MLRIAVDDSRLFAALKIAIFLRVAKVPKNDILLWNDLHLSPDRLKCLRWLAEERTSQLTAYVGSNLDSAACVISEASPHV